MVHCFGVKQGALDKIQKKAVRATTYCNYIKMHSVNDCIPIDITLGKKVH